MVDFIDVQGQRYPGYGRCIYCGGDGGHDGLRKEHIIPFSLGGNAWIDEASCRICEGILNRVDTYLAKRVFYEYRVHAQLQTRRPKERPQTLPVDFRLGTENWSATLAPADHPFRLALPVWGEAGIIDGRRIDASFPQIYVNVYNYIPENFTKIVGARSDEDVWVYARHRIDALLFARGIAKIAYGFAVIRFGLDGFRRLCLPDLILGKFSAISHFVGSQNVPPPPLSGQERHAIDFKVLQSKSGRMRLYVATVRLFANKGTKDHGLPIYHVVVGAPKTHESETSPE